MQITLDQQGHRTLSPEIISALAEVGERFGVNFSMQGGRLQSDRIVFNLAAKIANKDAAEEIAKKNFAAECRFIGLLPDDYGLEFQSTGGRFKIIGVKTNRPKYPIQAQSLRDNRIYKFGRLTEGQLNAARAERDEKREKERMDLLAEELKEFGSTVFSDFGSF